MTPGAWAGRSVLVTGAYGLLGGWLTRGLLESGARATVIRRDRTPRSALASMGLEPRVSVIHGDICDAGLLARALCEYEIDTVFHLAAQTLVPTANRSPVSTFETNIRGTWTLLEACRSFGALQRIVVASSDKAYGPHEDLPYREHYALQPIFPYDVSKAATDLIARSYWHTWRLPVAVTRFANLYGGGDFNASRLVPEAVSAALSGRPPVIRSDGSPERDFLYVEDAVAAYLAIAEALTAGGARGLRAGAGAGARAGARAGAAAGAAAAAAGEAYNAGGGRPHRVLDVVELICRLAGTGVEPDVRGAGIPAGEIDRQWVDATKLRELTGWEPQVSLDEGLRRTIDWYREYGMG
ncbi:MAG: GDP-mannose 4,6-dehydratase [Solirubrobacteraceae bacterium]